MSRLTIDPIENMSCPLEDFFGDSRHGDAEGQGPQRDARFVEFFNFGGGKLGDYGTTARTYKH